MRVLSLVLRVLLFCLLTLLTQVGGCVYLLSILTYRWMDRWASNYFLKIICRLACFIGMYGLTTLWLVPALAKPFGREPLPLREANHLQPLNVLTCLLNRHYVKPELKKLVGNVAKKMNEKFPGATLNYLDAGFPFIDGFPLFPHLSHNDGKKLDLSFRYINAKTGEPTNLCPSFIGYGICEEPLPGEQNTADLCDRKGYWQYSFLNKVVPQSNNREYKFDARKTGELVNLILTEPGIGKVFLEPHLKQRLKLNSDKIRFHGCQAVRHDDHLHIQLR